MDKTGRKRLSRMELLGPLDDWIDFSAWLAAPEFECFWRSILTRMRRDWGEPYMADYLEKNILVLSSNRKAMWRCAYDCCPLGFTTYAASGIESCWRAIKCHWRTVEAFNRVNRVVMDGCHTRPTEENMVRLASYIFQLAKDARRVSSTASS